MSKPEVSMSVRERFLTARDIWFEDGLVYLSNWDGTTTVYEWDGSLDGVPLSDLVEVEGEGQGMLPLEDGQ